MKPLFYRPNTPAVVSERFDDEVILVNLSRGNYYSLRDSGALVWQEFEAGRSTDEIAAQLAGWFGVEAATVAGTLEPFVGRLLEEQLLVGGQEPNPQTATFDGSALAGQPFNPPLLEVYTDMQELLALDPIHDVNPNEGWPIRR